MAVYMSAGRQRRRLIGVAVIAVVVGIIAGIVIGRATASGVDDAVAASRRRAQDLSAALQTLPLEYEQSRTNTAGEDQARIESAVQIVVDMVPTALNKAKWLSAASRQRVTGAVDAVQRAVSQKAAVDDVTALVNEAVAAINDVFPVQT